MPSSPPTPTAPPDHRREGVRYLPAALETPPVRLPARAEDDAGEGDGRTLYGHFAVFNRWAEIDSLWEGHFLERFAPGAFKKTIREGRARMRVLFQHGMDRDIGDKPIAAIQELREDDEGAYYESRLFDGLPDLVLEGLRAGQYGASHRFQAIREIYEEEPDPSDENPRGLPQRTVTEARVREFGPVTFPAYEDATALVRSLTDVVFRHRLGMADEPDDDALLALMQRDPERFRTLLAKVPDLAALAAAPSTPAPSNGSGSTPPRERRDNPARVPYGTAEEGTQEWTS